MRVLGRDEAGVEVAFHARASGPVERTLGEVASEITRRALAHQKAGPDLAFEYDSVTPAQIPVLYCFPRDARRTSPLRNFDRMPPVAFCR